MITTILIDIDNTLLDFKECAKESIRKGFADNGLEFNDKVMPTFHQINDGLWQQIENGTLTRDGLHKIRFNLVLGALGISGINGEEFEKQFIENLYNSHSAVDGAYEFLKYLSEKYTLCAASNGPYEQQRHRLECADMLKYFAHIFVSEDIGCSKPQQEFFAECQKRLGGIPKEEMFLIGDSQSADIAGAVNFGIKSCWFNFFNTDENTLADYTVNSLIDIDKIL